MPFRQHDGGNEDADKQGQRQRSRKRIKEGRGRREMMVERQTAWYRQDDQGEVKDQYPELSQHALERGEVAHVLVGFEDVLDRFHVEVEQRHENDHHHRDDPEPNSFEWPLEFQVLEKVPLDEKHQQRHSDADFLAAERGEPTKRGRCNAGDSAAAGDSCFPADDVQAQCQQYEHRCQTGHALHDVGHRLDLQRMYGPDRCRGGCDQRDPCRGDFELRFFAGGLELQDQAQQPINQARIDDVNHNVDEPIAARIVAVCQIVERKAQVGYRAPVRWCVESCRLQLRRVEAGDADIRVVPNVLAVVEDEVVIQRVQIQDQREDGEEWQRPSVVWLQ